MNLLYLLKTTYIILLFLFPSTLFSSCQVLHCSTIESQKCYIQYMNNLLNIYICDHLKIYNFL